MVTNVIRNFLENGSLQIIRNSVTAFNSLSKRAVIHFRRNAVSFLAFCQGVRYLLGRFL